MGKPLYPHLKTIAKLQRLDKKTRSRHYADLVEKYLETELYPGQWYLVNPTPLELEKMLSVKVRVIGDYEENRGVMTIPIMDMLADDIDVLCAVAHEIGHARTPHISPKLYGRKIAEERAERAAIIEGAQVARRWGILPRFIEYSKQTVTTYEFKIEDGFWVTL